MLKSIMINKITEFAKKNLRLSESQISVRKKNRKNFKIVDRKNTHNMKTKKNKIVTIMSVNVTETYVHVLHIRFLHNLKKEKISN